MNPPVPARNPSVEDWPLPVRFGFRVAFVYFSLYVATGPFGFFFSGDWRRDPISVAYDRAIVWLIGPARWLGQWVLSNPTVNPRAATDDWHTCVGFLLLAASSAAVWSLLDRKRGNYRTLHDWLRLVMRWTLGFVLVWYGVIKIIGDQFNTGSLSLYRLMTPVGGLSPASLLWVTMTYGSGYVVGAGLVELVAGLLLFSRRTVTAGALLAIGAMGNVFLLNVVYGIHLKAFSLHLLLMAAFLAIPNARRVFDAVVLGRGVPAVTLRPLVTDVRVRRLGYLSGLALVGHGLYVGLNPVDRYRDRHLDQALISPLYGVYEVEAFARNGQEVPPTLGEATRWRYFLVERTGYGTAWLMSDSVADFLTSVDTSRAVLRLFTPPGRDTVDHLLLGSYGTIPRYDARYWYGQSYQAALKDVASAAGAEYGRLTYKRLPADRLALSGHLGSDSVAITLRRHDRNELFLFKWPVRWTYDEEYPATNAETLTPSAPWRGPAPVPTARPH